MTPREQRAAEILKRVDGIQHPRVAEVGVLNGLLSFMLLERRRDLHLVMVDNWRAAEAQPEDYRATGDISALCEDTAAIENEARLVSARFPRRSRVVKGDSAKVANQFADSHFDLVFIDADHSESGVAADIEAWMPKVCPLGWLGGHDYGHDSEEYDFSGVKRAVDSAFPFVETGDNFTWWVRC